MNLSCLRERVLKYLVFVIVNHISIHNQTHMQTSFIMMLICKQSLVDGGGVGRKGRKEKPLRVNSIDVIVLPNTHTWI